MSKWTSEWSSNKRTEIEVAVTNLVTPLYAEYEQACPGRGDDGFLEWLEATHPHSLARLKSHHASLEALIITEAWGAAATRAIEAGETSMTPPDEAELFKEHVTEDMFDLSPEESREAWKSKRIRDELQYGDSEPDTDLPF